MNDRIKELSTQAANYANTYDDAGADIWFEMYNQKFAELIIRECTNIVLHYTDVDEGVAVAKKHFGVKE